MKNIYFNILFMAICLIAITGCNKDEDTIASDLIILKAQTNMDAQGGEGYVEICSTQQITAKFTEGDWCTIKEISNDKVTFTVNANYGYSGRAAQLVIDNGISNQKLTVTQAGAIFIFEDNKWIQRVTNEAAILPVKQYGSFPCIVSIPEEAKSWLSYKEDTNGKGGKFSLTKNTSGNIRASVVTVTCGDRSFDYQILQYEVDDFLGKWNGQFTPNLQTYYRLQDVVINKEEENIYSVSNLLTGQPYILKGTVENNTLIFEAGQYLGKMNDLLYLGLGVIDNQGYFKEEGYKIGLGPAIMQDGTIALVFDDTLGNYPSIGFAFLGYLDEYLDEYYASIATFANCILYK